MSVALLKAILAYKELQRKTNNKEDAEDFPWNLSYGYKFESEDKICRICCKTGGIPIFNKSELHDEDLGNAINLCSDLSVSENDDLPRYLCESCHSLLQSAMKFRQMSQVSLQKLRRLKIQRSDMFLPLEPKVEISCEDITDVSASLALHRCHCGEVFESMADFCEHLSRCTSKRKKQKYVNKKVPLSYLCDICGKRSRSRAQHAIHATIHTNDFPYHCEHCPYKGRHKNMLVMHLKSHLTVKPFMCESCPRTFTSTSNLKRHRTVHQPQPVPCPQCQNMYASQRQLTCHIENMHNGGTPIACNICSKIYKCWKSLKKHRFNVHHVVLPKRAGRYPDYLLHELGVPKYDKLAALNTSPDATPDILACPL